MASTHDLAEAEAFADRVIVLREGEVVLSGRVADILEAAGGDWRLRITDPPQGALALIREARLPAVNAGAQTVVIGARERIDLLRESLGAAYGAMDILSGPVRLEDLFLFSKKEAA